MSGVQSARPIFLKMRGRSGGGGGGGGVVGRGRGSVISDQGLVIGEERVRGLSRGVLDQFVVHHADGRRAAAGQTFDKLDAVIPIRAHGEIGRASCRERV